jgi:general secretion pathway protein C
VGDRIDDGVLVGIGHGEIFVSRGERIERIGTGAPSVITPTAPPTMDLVRTARARVNAALRDPTSVMSEVRMLPAFVEGRWQGLRATWVKEGSWLAELGLQRGDVIRAVNGRPLDGLESSMAVLAELPTRQEVEVEIDRNGQRAVRRVRIE